MNTYTPINDPGLSIKPIFLQNSFFLNPQHGFWHIRIQNMPTLPDYLGVSSFLLIIFIHSTVLGAFLR